MSTPEDPEPDLPSGQQPNPDPAPDPLGELPPDPFPGDPFAEFESGPANEQTPEGTDGPSRPGSTNGGDAGAADDPLAALRDQLGNLGGLGGLGGLGPLLAQFGRAGANSGRPTMQWDVARQIAIWTAAGGAVEPGVDPLDRIRLEKTVTEVAPLIENATGLAIPKPSLRAEAVTRAGWAAAALEDYRTLLDNLAVGLAAASADIDGATGTDSDRADADAFAAMAPLFAMLAPTLSASQAGALVGQLGTKAIGDYDLLLPRPPGPLHLIPVNAAAFAAEWSVPEQAVTTLAVIIDLLTEAVLTQPHVAQRLSALLAAHAAAARIDFGAMGDAAAQLGDLSDLGSLGGGGKPNDEIVKAFTPSPTPEQLRIRAELRSLVAPILGYLDFHTAVISARVLGDNRQLMEAWRRRRRQSEIGESALQIFGLPFDQEIETQGSAFIGGVMQRRGSDGLAALFAAPENLPTAAEVAAPGLWLARLGLLD